MAGKVTRTKRARFEEKYERRAPNECWPWTAWEGKDRLGKPTYGKFLWDGCNINAQRAAHMLYVGPIPEGMSVLHRCDNPRCVNPEHLFLGTQLDNIADMKAKGRGRGAPKLGGENGRARLSEADALQIIGSTGRTTDLAAKFGVSIPTISHIRSGRTWKHIKGANNGRTAA